MDKLQQDAAVSNISISTRFHCRWATEPELATATTISHYKPWAGRPAMLYMLTA